MGEYYTYTKFRHEFGRYCQFQDTEVRVVTPPINDSEYLADGTRNKNYPYVKRNPNFITLSNIPRYSENIVRTRIYPYIHILLPR